MRRETCAHARPFFPFSPWPGLNMKPYLMPLMVLMD